MDCSSVNAQPEGINGGPVNVPTEGIIDGVFIQEHIPTKRMIPYEYVREADAIWSRRVWEYIDLREKINHNCITHWMRLLPCRYMGKKCI